jgi:hypothetical protein
MPGRNFTPLKYSLSKKKLMNKAKIIIDRTIVVTVFLFGIGGRFAQIQGSAVPGKVTGTLNTAPNYSTLKH